LGWMGLGCQGLGLWILGLGTFGTCLICDFKVQVLLFGSGFRIAHEVGISGGLNLARSRCGAWPVGTVAVAVGGAAGSVAVAVAAGSVAVCGWAVAVGPGRCAAGCWPP
jgi:hypothetical protein